MYDYFTINFSKYFAYEDEISKLNEKIEKIKVLNNLPSSTIQIDSIIKANTSIAQKEINKREALFYILANNSVDIKDITLQGNVIDINLFDVDKKKIQEYILKKYKIISSTSNNLILNIKVQL